MEPIYVVLIIILIIWIGIFGYMIYLDKEVKKVSEKLTRIENEEAKK
jgi:CcmD family protein